MRSGLLPYLDDTSFSPRGVFRNALQYVTEHSNFQSIAPVQRVSHKHLSVSLPFCLLTIDKRRSGIITPYAALFSLV
jgi:hypothetical protein